jgi:hypothetical protein
MVVTDNHSNSTQHKQSVAADMTKDQGCGESPM